MFRNLAAPFIELKEKVTSRYNNAHNDAIITERIKLIFDQPLYIIMLAQQAMLLLTTWYLWDDNYQNLLIIWLIISSILTLSMIYLAFVFKTKETVERPQLWIMILILFAILNGLAWGVPALLPGLFDSDNAILFVSIMLLGIVAAALPVISYVVIVFNLFSSLTLLPMTLMFFYTGGPLYSTFGVMFLVYLAVQLISAKYIQGVSVQSLQLRYENMDLVSDLQIKNHQAELAREDAEQANTAKSKFLAVASHDLRQPLHALGLFISKVNNEQRYPAIHKDIENIQKSSDALEDLLNGLLDISKLDAGIIQPEIVPLDLHLLLDRVSSHGHCQAIEKGLRFRLRSTDKVVLSDPHLLERILNNLISNAIRYTTTGSVFIGCRQRNNHLRIEIRDSGIGINKNELGDIFDEFYQVDNPERDRSKGLGLGLSIVERLCSLLDLNLTVHSAPGEGSVFGIDIPFIKTTSQAKTEISALSLKPFTSDVAGLSVLVIDDEVMIREGMASMLAGWGCSYLLADSAETAIHSLKNNNIVPDIIITDYRLRENKTGAQAIKQIQKLFENDIAAIIVTGDTASDRLQEAKESGYQLLHKPVAPAKLRSVLSYLKP